MKKNKSVLTVAVDPSETLRCYASGDGALHFTWIAGGVATGRPVTGAEAQAWLDSPNENHLRDAGWRVVMIGTRPILVAPVARINENTLSLRGRNYEYTIDQSNIFWQRDRHVMQSCLSLVTKDDDGQPVNVRNVSTIACIAHFLNYEKVLASQPIEPKPLPEAPGVG